jgi:electron transfer flavoprotein beta subunit
LLNIVVCVKQAPDTAGERKLRPDDATLDREAVDGLINELDEYAIEEALQIAEAHGGEVTVLTMGPEKATESIRKALSMGAGKAVHLVDDALAGSDALQTSYALAQVLGTIAARPPRQAGTIVKDEGDGGAKAAEFLAANKFI